MVRSILKLGFQNWPLILLYCNLIGCSSTHVIGHKQDQRFHFGSLIWKSDLESDWCFVEPYDWPQPGAASLVCSLGIKASSSSITGFYTRITLHYWLPSPAKQRRKSFRQRSSSYTAACHLLQEPSCQLIFKPQDWPYTGSTFFFFFRHLIFNWILD